MDQRLTRLEQDARQPRRAMEVDGQADTKTRERTEGAATAVQAMDGDSCSAIRVDPNPMCSISFGNDCAEPLALPYSGENSLVDNGAAVLESFLQPLEMRTTRAAGGLLPTGDNSTVTKITFKQSPLRLYLTEETNLRTSLNPCRTTAASGRVTCLLPPPAGGSSRQNTSKIGCSIQAVLKVARCFMEKFMLGLDEAAAFFWRINDRGINLQKSGAGELFTPYV